MYWSPNLLRGYALAMNTEYIGACLPTSQIAISSCRIRPSSCPWRARRCRSGWCRASCPRWRGWAWRCACCAGRRPRSSRSRRSCCATGRRPTTWSPRYSRSTRGGSPPRPTLTMWVTNCRVVLTLNERCVVIFHGIKCDINLPLNLLEHLLVAAFVYNTLYSMYCSTYIRSHLPSNL